jgi:integrase
MTPTPRRPLSRARRSTEETPFGELLRNISAYSGRNGNLVGIAVQLLAMTFVRPGTAAAAKWDHFDLDGAMWTIPANELKMKTFRDTVKELKDKPHQVPLSRQAVALLRELKELTGWSTFLFPGRKGSRPISEQGLEVALNALGYQGVHCPHGFRSSASTAGDPAKLAAGDVTALASGAGRHPEIDAKNQKPIPRSGPLFAGHGPARRDGDA